MIATTIKVLQEFKMAAIPITVAYSQNESRNRTSFRIPMKSTLFECREFKIQKNFEIL